MAGLDRSYSKEGDGKKNGYLKSGFNIYGPLLLLLPAEELAVITMHSALRDIMVGETLSSL